MHRLLHVLCGAGIALVLALGGARATTALSPDSHLVTRDRFSDEIVGTGPDLVFIPGLVSSRATWKATADRPSRARLMDGRVKLGHDGKEGTGQTPNLSLTRNGVSPSARRLRSVTA